MILTDEKQDVDFSSNVKGSNFTILASSKAFQILSSNIYSYKVRAIIREISTNAYDAHVDAKNPEPFNVHLPTRLEPWFCVRDFGTGISHDQMMTFYAQFFKSTRNESNEFCGALGIGRMAPLCLVDSFTVESFYNQERRIYSVFKNEDGVPSISCLSTSYTDEPNGVLVRVDVSRDDIQEYFEEAVQTYKYFAILPNINNSDVNKQIQDYKKSLVIQNDSVRTSLTNGNLVAVMGNVAYDIPSNYSDVYLSGELLFNIGELSFTPGRETLAMDTKTINAIKAAVSKFRSNIVAHIESVVEQEPTEFKKLIAAEKYGSCYKGDAKVAQAIAKTINKYKKVLTTQAIVYNYNWRGSVSQYMSKDYHTNKAEFFLFKKGFATRAREYCRENKVDLFVLTQEQADQIGVDPDLLKDMSTMPKIVRAKAATVKKGDVFKGSYDKNYRGVTWQETTTVSSGNKFYIVGSRSNSHYNNNLHKMLAAAIHFGIIDDKVDFYMISNKMFRKKSFQKDTSWIGLDSFLKTEAAKIKPVEKVLNNHYNFTNNIKPIATDPRCPVEIKDLYSLCNKKNNEEILQKAELIGVPIVDNDIIDVTIKDIYSKWPMLRALDMYSAVREKDLRDIVLSYLNS